ncbi:amidohydrolase family protein [Pantoea sp. C3]|uniref:amidohydrolase family protein n=1 Tax=Pantoea phytostimulans TaxID=2769024 RepID=UPI0038F7D88E
MLRIDAHQHFWHYQPEAFSWVDNSALKQDFLPAQLRSELSAAKIDGCIAVQARPCEAENQFLCDLAARHDEILGVVGWIDLQQPDPVALDPRCCGFRHPVQDEADPVAWLASDVVARGMRQLQQQQFSWDLLVTHHHMQQAAVFAQRHDAHWIVLDHLGKPDIAAGAEQWKQQIAPLAALPHVVCKLSGLVTEAGAGWQGAQLLPFFDAALALFGPSRLMFGSDWPVSQGEARYQQVCDLCQQLTQTLSQPEQQAIWGGTAQRVYLKGNTA